MNKRKLSIVKLLAVTAILLLGAKQTISAKAENIPVTGFRTPAMSDLPHSIAVLGFRTPPMSDLPHPIGVSSFFQSFSAAGFRTPPMTDYNNKSSIAVTGFRTPPMSDLPHSLAAAVYMQYEYGPAILATGFASPAKSNSYGAFPNVPWWH
jgi:hypothetical protein